MRRAGGEGTSTHCPSRHSDETSSLSSCGNAGFFADRSFSSFCKIWRSSAGLVEAPDMVRDNRAGRSGFAGLGLVSLDMVLRGYG